MESSSVLPADRGGGVVWAAVVAVLAALWAGSLNPWLTSSASWVAVTTGWIIVKRIKRAISAEEAWGAWASLSLLAVFASACGLALVQLRLVLINPFGRSSPLRQTLESLIGGGDWIVAIALGLLVAAIGGAWLLSSAIPCAAAGGGFRIHVIVVRAFQQLKRNRAASSFAVAAGGMTVAAAMIGSHAEAPIRIVIGLAAAYTQLYWLALSDRRLPKSEYVASGRGNKSKTGRRNGRVVLGSLIALHVIFTAFYISLFGAFYGWSWQVPIVYAFIWISGAIWALIARFLALSRIAYAVVMILLGLVCALLLGMIAGVYDWEMLI